MAGMSDDQQIMRDAAREFGAEAFFVEEVLEGRTWVHLVRPGIEVTFRDHFGSKHRGSLFRSQGMVTMLGVGRTMEEAVVDARLKIEIEKRPKKLRRDAEPQPLRTFKYRPDTKPPLPTCGTSRPLDQFYAARPADPAPAAPALPALAELDFK